MIHRAKQRIYRASGEISGCADFSDNAAVRPGVIRSDTKD